ncbi:MAG: hypothetical protein ACOC5T_07250, partial [Elusimicrobiota bacterium]
SVFVADDDPPRINFVDKTTSEGNYTQTYIEANVTAEDSYLENVTISLYNSTGLYQSEIRDEGFFYNFTSLPDGNYYLNATANDSSSKTNSTETRHIKLDNSAPKIEKPANITITYPNGINESFNFSDLSEYSVFVNDSQFKFENDNLLNNTQLSVGNYTLNVSANDTFGFTNWTLYYVFVEGATPTFNQSDNSPVDYKQSLNYSANETNKGDSDLVYNLYRNGTLIDSGSQVSDSSKLGAGNYVYVYNTTGGENYTSGNISDVLTINKIEPTINLTINGTRDNISIEKDQKIWINGSEIEGDGKGVDLYINGSINDSGLNPSSYYNFTQRKYYEIISKYNETQNYTSKNISLFVKVRAVLLAFSFGINEIVYDPYHLTEQDVWPENQTYSLGAYNVTNYGNEDHDVYMKSDNETTGWSFEASNDTENWINLTDNYTKVYNQLNSSESNFIWLRADLDNPSEEWNGTYSVASEDFIWE